MKAIKLITFKAHIKNWLLTKLAALSMLAISPVSAQGDFDVNTDIFIPQFDSFPDTDDIQTIAAIGSMLLHPEFAEVNYLAVAGAFGDQEFSNPDFVYIPAPQLFDLAFGTGIANWVDAEADRDLAAAQVANRVAPILLDGGRAWIMEAGQSNVTHQMLLKLPARGVSASLIRDNVIVVQHSAYNEGVTNDVSLAYVKANANYVAIDDGNRATGTGADRGDDTPDFSDPDNQWLDMLPQSPNRNAVALWDEAARVIATSNYVNGNIEDGGVDFSDAVEAIWIFDDNIRNIGDFWSKYITNSPGLPIDGDKISLRGNNNRYLNSGNGVRRAIFNRTAALGQEIFEVVELSNGYYALKASNGLFGYVLAENNDNELIFVLRDTQHIRTQFELVESNGLLALKSLSNGRYLSSENGNRNARANRTAIGAWERFDWTR